VRQVVDGVELALELDGQIAEDWTAFKHLQITIDESRDLAAGVDGKKRRLFVLALGQVHILDFNVVLEASVVYEPEDQS